MLRGTLRAIAARALSGGLVRLRGGRAAAALVIVLVELASSRDVRADDGALARDIVHALEADAAHATIIGEPLGRAREAIERATRLREAGDEARAKAADGLALEWAETARDSARAADAERAAAARREQAVTKQAQVERARALVEADLAHVGRLRKEIDDAGGPGRPRDASNERTAVEVHDGKPPPKASAKKPSKSPPPEPAPPGDRP